MKLGRDISHLNTIHLDRNEGGSEWLGGWGVQKTVKKCHEISIISALTWTNNSLENATDVGFFLLST